MRQINRYNKQIHIDYIHDISSLHDIPSLQYNRPFLYGAYDVTQIPVQFLKGVSTHTGICNSTEHTQYGSPTRLSPTRTLCALINGGKNPLSTFVALKDITPPKMPKLIQVFSSTICCPDHSAKEK